ncbi:hypothetical protein AAA627_39225, partial [Pseudomonas aeruginosa]
DIARDDSSGKVSSFKNISASVESSNDLRLLAEVVENKKEIFDVSSEFLSGAIGVRCFDCSAVGGKEDKFASHLVLLENYKTQLLKDSPSSNITSRGNIFILGGRLKNQGSTIAAAGDISISAQDFANEGYVLGEYSVRKALDFNYSYEARVEVWRKIMEYNSINDLAYDNGKIEYSNFGGAVHFWNKNWDESIVDSVYFRTGGRDGYWHAGFGTIVIDDIARDKFDYISVAPAYDPSRGALPPDFLRNAKVFDELTISKSDVAPVANAVVQAGGKVSINAEKSLQNSIVREGQPISRGVEKNLLTGLSGNTSNVVVLSQALPPDLARQQINPLTLPGFSLPQGQNGLFRLASQGAQVN